MTISVSFIHFEFSRFSVCHQIKYLVVGFSHIFSLLLSSHWPAAVLSRPNYKMTGSITILIIIPCHISSHRNGRQLLTIHHVEHNWEVYTLLFYVKFYWNFQINLKFKFTDTTHLLDETVITLESVQNELTSNLNKFRLNI